MPSFRQAKSQVAHALRKKWGIGQSRHQKKEMQKRMQKNDFKIHSLGTKRNYMQALMRFTQWIQNNHLGDLNTVTAEKAIHFLEWRSQTVGQKMLDQERQAIQMHLGATLPVIKSELEEVLTSRSYTPEQVALIISGQTEKYALATQIAYAAGLRAHELFTLQPIEQQSASTHRIWSNKRFSGLQGKIYTVCGKGGLIREVMIPENLAVQLEALRLNEPMLQYDREIKYTQHYAIGGGKAWSNSFSAASQRILNWSHGAHGLRHSYAQQRMNTLQGMGFQYESALAIVSQELGHFSPTITEVYLR